MNRLYVIIFFVIVLIPVVSWGWKVFNYVDTERKTAEYETLADQNNDVVDAVNSVISSANTRNTLIRQAINPANEHRNGAVELMKMTGDDLAREIAAVRAKVEAAILPDNDAAEEFRAQGLALLEVYEQSLPVYADISTLVTNNDLSDDERQKVVEEKLGPLEQQFDTVVSKLEDARMAYVDASRPR